MNIHPISCLSCSLSCSFSALLRLTVFVPLVLSSSSHTGQADLTMFVKVDDHMAAFFQVLFTVSTLQIRFIRTVS